MIASSLIFAITAGRGDSEPQHGKSTLICLHLASLTPNRLKDHQPLIYELVALVIKPLNLDEHLLALRQTFAIFSAGLSNPIPNL